MFTISSAGCRVVNVMLCSFTGQQTAQILCQVCPAMNGTLELPNGSKTVTLPFYSRRNLTTFQRRICCIYTRFHTPTE